MTQRDMASPSEYELLDAISATPVTTQADLAAQVGVAVGTVNWYLKRWSQKGYIKIKRIGRWQWSYLLTPEGIARKARLAGAYVEASLALYRRMRTEARQLLVDVKSTGYNQIVLAGEGEIADICRLTCLELDIGVAPGECAQLPVLVVDGVQLTLHYPARNRPGATAVGETIDAATPTRNDR